jgi:transposase InsO family protein
MAGLVDRSKRPRSCPHRTPARAELNVIELRREHPRWGPRRLAYELARKGADPAPSRSSIYRILVRSGLVEPRARRRKRSDYVRWERARPMELWQLDVVAARLEGGSAVKILTGVDDHSRFCVVASAMPRATARPLCEAFAQALAAYGVPQAVLTDNGRVFNGRAARSRHEVLFDRICRENGILHLLTAVRSPTTTGKIERFHRTLRDELFSTRILTSVADVQRALDHYVAAYNTLRPHQALGMATPIERFSLAGPHAAPLTGALEGEVIEDALPSEHIRRVDGNGRIHFAGTRYCGAWVGPRLRDGSDRRGRGPDLLPRLADPLPRAAPPKGEGGGDLEPPSTAEEQECPLGRCQTSGEDGPSSVWWDSTIADGSAPPRSLPVRSPARMQVASLRSPTRRGREDAGPGPARPRPSRRIV